MMNLIYYLFITIMVLFFPVNSFAVAPLYYHTFAIAEIEASVEEICTIGIPTVKTEELMSRKSKEESSYIMEAQKIKVRVTKVLRFTKRDAKVENIFIGKRISITNHFVDQKPPFKVGDQIKTRLRLVQPEKKYNPKDTRKEWWFFPPGAKEDFFPPRHPFNSIK